MAGDARDRLLVEAAHVGEDDLVGADERIGELLPHDRGAGVAERLEHGDDPAPVALRRGPDRGLDLRRQQRVVVDDRDAVELAPVLDATGAASEASATPNHNEIAAAAVADCALWRPVTGSRTSPSATPSRTSTNDEPSRPPRYSVAR